MFCVLRDHMDRMVFVTKKSTRKNLNIIVPNENKEILIRPARLQIEYQPSRIWLTDVTTSDIHSISKEIPFVDNYIYKRYINYEISGPRIKLQNPTIHTMQVQLSSCELCFMSFMWSLKTYLLDEISDENMFLKTLLWNQMYSSCFDTNVQCAIHIIETLYQDDPSINTDALVNILGTLHRTLNSTYLQSTDIPNNFYLHDISKRLHGFCLLDSGESQEELVKLKFYSDSKFGESNFEQKLFIITNIERTTNSNQGINHIKVSYYENVLNPAFTTGEDDYDDMCYHCKRKVLEDTDDTDTLATCDRENCFKAWHFRCAGISRDEFDRFNKWYCPDCIKSPFVKIKFQ